MTTIAAVAALLLLLALVFISILTTVMIANGKSLWTLCAEPWYPLQFLFLYIILCSAKESCISSVGCNTDFPCLYSYKGIKHFDENFAAKTTSILNTVTLLLSSNITVGHPVTNKSHPITDFWQESCLCFHTLLAYFYLCEWSVLVSWFWLG